MPPHRRQHVGDAAGVRDLDLVVSIDRKLQQRIAAQRLNPRVRPVPPHRFQHVFDAPGVRDLDLDVSIVEGKSLQRTAASLLHLRVRPVLAHLCQHVLDTLGRAGLHCSEEHDEETGREGDGGRAARRARLADRGSTLSSRQPWPLLSRPCHPVYWSNSLAARASCSTQPGPARPGQQPCGVDQVFR